MSNKNIRETDRNQKACKKDFFRAIKEDIKKNGLIKSEKAGNKLINLIGKTAVIVFFISSLISAVLILTSSPPSPPPDIYDMFGIDAVQISALDQKIFDPDKPVPGQLSQIILSDNVRVYKNDSLRFVMSKNKAEEDELPKLSEKIKNAFETETENGVNETVMYYLVLFDDNRKVNFSLSETTLEVNGKKYTLKQ